MAEKKVAIIITTYNQEKLLEACLESLKKTNYKNYKIYFLDDSGKGEIGKRIKKKFKIDVIINKENLGFSKSNNVGIKKVLKEFDPDYILLLNDDTEIVDKNWLKKLVEIGNSDDKIGILGGRIIYPDGSLQNVGGYLKKWKIVKELDENKKDIFEVDHVMGAFMLMKKEVLDKIGLLDEVYSPFLLEDTDYCLRAKKTGFKIVSVPFVKIIHKKGKSIDSLKERKIMKVRFKNDVVFSIRHLKGWDRFFRIFIYLPMVAAFRKKDEADLKLKNFELRKDFLKNLLLWFRALF